MTPVMGGTALPVRRWEGRGALWTMLGMSRFYPYCVPWNHLGNPAMSVPAGFAADGMPLAVQIVGRPGDEATLLSLAAQLEAERPWADKRPPICAGRLASGGWCGGVGCPSTFAGLFAWQRRGRPRNLRCETDAASTRGTRLLAEPHR